MLVSYNWLEYYLKNHAEKNGAKPYKLPPAEKLADLLIFNAFEVESLERKGGDYIIDVKVLPNRSHDSLSHRGIAREIARLLGKKLFPEKLSDYKITSEKEVFVEIKETKLCPRYMAVPFENIKVGDSPAWIKERLESVGQRSINNIVDITNFVMLETGQPLHAFDLDKISSDSKGNPEIVVRSAKDGEKLNTLDGKDLSLSAGMLVIADKIKAVALAGIKGGKFAEVGPGTKNIIIESANFEGVLVRKTSRAFSLRTESSSRFEQGMAPEMAEEGMRLAVNLILKHASTPETKVGLISDAYPKKRAPYKVGVSVSEVNKLLGTKLSEKKVAELLSKLDLPFEIVDPIRKITDLAPRLEGVPYKYGASISYDAPAAFDCSSFTAYLFSQAGIGIPRMAVDQYVFGMPVKEKELKAGDLIFSNSGSGKIYYESVEFIPGKIKISEGIDHVALYIGRGEVVHAARRSGKVVREKIDEHIKLGGIIGYRRIITSKEKRFVVTAPPERLDLMATRSFLISGIKEDLIEDIGRAYGYGNIKAVKPKIKNKLPNDEKFDKANSVRAALVKEGYSEVMTYTFVNNGEIELENPIAEDKKFLRGNLGDEVIKASLFNVRFAKLLGIEEIKIFEIGTIFKKSGEEIMVATVSLKIYPISPEPASKSAGAGGQVKGYTLNEAYEKFGKSASSKIGNKKVIKYKPISPYPFILRDIAVFVPEKVKSGEVLGVIKKEGGNLLVKYRLFDEFRKDGRISYAFNLVFQSHEKTLSDEEVNKTMEGIISVINSKTGWRVR